MIFKKTLIYLHRKTTKKKSNKNIGRGIMWKTYYTQNNLCIEIQWGKTNSLIYCTFGK